MDCKITNSNRRNLNLKPKRLYFNYFKDRFIHFNGTVVFHLHKISINKENIDSSELDLGSVSTICVSDGSGDKEFSEKWLGYNHDSKSFNEYATSRGAFRFVYDTIPIISDEYVGGHMQALVLYRGKEKPVAIGVLYEDGAYVLGKKNHSDIGIDIEYRNENFEIIDPSTMKIKEGAQRQPFATR